MSNQVQANYSEFLAHLRNRNPYLVSRFQDVNLPRAFQFISLLRTRLIEQQHLSPDQAVFFVTNYCFQESKMISISLSTENVRKLANRIMKATCPSMQNGPTVEKIQPKEESQEDMQGEDLYDCLSNCDSLSSLDNEKKADDSKGIEKIIREESKKGKSLKRKKISDRDDSDVQLKKYKG